MTVTPTVVTAAQLYIGGFDYTNDIHHLRLSYGCDPKEASVFSGSGWRAKKPGLKSVAVEATGYVNFAYEGSDTVVPAQTTQDSQSFNKLGVDNMPVSIVPLGTTQANLAYLFNGEEFFYSPGAKLGDMMGFTVRAEPVTNGNLVRGQLGTYRTVSANGSLANALALAGPSAAQSIYANFHVFSVGNSTGGTIAVTIKGKASGAFTGAEPDLVSFSSTGSVGGQFKKVAGDGTTATYTTYSIFWIVTGVATFTFAVTLGVL